ncbi:GTP-binding protein (plasmid) [Ralstonia solanacearum]|uniref:CobW family GTP-binding protein n=1 Tax=Ralstonia pseudosolanacearum TaxID=1310165 RepID=UPI000B60A642|nr:GTP-binding protein [Ralstonia pseudosolanacearum]QIK26223.1 GTP-binding protein [Ralstonia solanacearum]ASL76751.1 cobalamin biosynthesis protein P47K [Ralstonia pseudosolanacearum]MCK4119950.1 GTP-binding protein [Ralstonia pseudosolanacearum]QIK30959.1 GTP-binding protein [Ralstonia solanacearum]QIK36074.1 GTP-binding protein [Ralstonia solanacearum]
MTQRIPVTVFTGFLGAGKTTLLSGLIRDNKQRRLAILVNEFGEVSIDGALLRGDGERGGAEVHDLSNGLIAYDDDADFLPTMQALWQRRGTIDHVLIETSGLALPTAVMESLQSEALAPYFVLDATLAVVDTPLLLSGGFNRAADDAATQTPIASLFEQQLANADIVVLNKIDALVEDAQLDAEARVRALAPSVRFIELAFDARLDTRLTLGLRLHEPAGTAHRHYGPVATLPGLNLRPLANQRLLDGHSHGGQGAHSHGLATHKHFHERDPGWQSFMVCSHDAQDADTLRHAVAAITRSEPILRAKGFARAGAGRVLIQAVRNRVEARLELDAAPPKQAQLVFIGYHPSRPRVAEQLRELTGTDWR